MPDCCAIDFGTSNSALAFADADGIALARLEGDFEGMPTAVFYAAEDGARHYGRAAIAAYVDGHEGRLMRSIKSILGSELMDEATELAPGLPLLRYRDVVVAYLRRLKAVAEAQRGTPLTRAVLGRPVYFVDDDTRRDARAQDTLAQAARAAGFGEVSFQYEPVAAALDYESRLTAADGERHVLVADIGGGTSDFTVLRASPAAHARADRRADLLANHGVHIAGTDFDRALNLAAIMPLLGFGSRGPQGREVPGRIYFDLATWHLIHATATPHRLVELRLMRPMYADPRAHERLLRVLQHRLGHALAAAAEAAKIEVALRGKASIDLTAVEAGLVAEVDAPLQDAALADGVTRIVAAAQETVRRAGLRPADLHAVYYTGGSTGLTGLTGALGAAFPQAARVHGDRFASVVSGLAITARQRYGG